jgi:excisionase family DNA binding protein
MTNEPTHSRPADRLTCSVEEAALLLGISRNSAYEAARKGEIPTIRLGRRILIPVSRLEDLLASR